MRKSGETVLAEDLVAMSRGKAAHKPGDDELGLIKRTAVLAMFVDDELFDLLVLKGGNAMDLIHQEHSRASVDLDFSMPGDLDVPTVEPRIERALRETFADRGYTAFDVHLENKPRKLKPDLESFWGGYKVSFKLISSERAAQIGDDLEVMRREAIVLGTSTAFTIDISRHEDTKAKQPYEMDGMTIYAYPPEMIVCEKLRAICQQMPEYGPVIGRSEKAGHQRARDFIDIDVLLGSTAFQIDLTAPRVQEMLQEVFRIKHVPLALLGKIKDCRAFHETGYDEVRNTMRPGVEVKPFAAYFDAVVKACAALEPLWHV